MAPAQMNNNAENTEALENGELVKELKNTPIGGFASIEEFAKDGFTEIIAATRAVNAFPQGAARDLYCAYPSFGKVIDEQSDRILGIISKVLKWQNIHGNIQRRQEDEQFEMLLECNDIIHERLSSNLDEAAGFKRKSQTVVIESVINTSTPATVTSGKKQGTWNLRKEQDNPLAARLITAKNIARPQLKFRIPVDNSALRPFIPKLKDKPNSIKPLAILPEYDDDGNEVSYLHPYEFELKKFEVPATQLKRKSTTKPAEMADTDWVYVDTVDKLNKVLEELRNHSEIAIDVEHHSYRTYLGFTCLVQMSTRNKDYLFDALALREDMHVLNAVLTDPSIVKIFHGADLDILWLQRDLSLYIVNMFDTHQAAKVLGHARRSLAYLLKHYCDIDADKTFQLADWRMRPLPQELISYARQDTHFLIYIHECLTNEVLDIGNQQPQLLRTVYQESTELCQQRYEKPVVTINSHLDFFRRSKRIFDNRQLFALRELFCWRDSMARKEDESLGYVLPNHMLVQIADSLPREMQGILACCNPIPPLVRQNLHALHQIVLLAREQPLVKPIIESQATKRDDNSNAKYFSSKLYCPHDLSHRDEFRDDLPTLLNSQHLEATSDCVQLSEPVFSIFNTTVAQSKEQQLLMKQKLIFGRPMPITPYQRYVAILPLLEQEKRDEAKRIEEENKKRRLCPAAVPMLSIKIEDENLQQAEDDIYDLPIKEMLKRKYEESVAKKAAGTAVDNTDSPQAKRLKTTGLNDDNKLNFVNLPPTKKEKKILEATNKADRKQFRSNSTKNNDSDAPHEMPSTSQATSTQTKPPEQRSKKNPQKFNNKNKKNKFKSQKHPQSSDKPVNFDYKNVDFKKFQGGSQRAKAAELRPQFHAKSNGNKANNKKMNKLFTFSNVKGNKK